MGFSQATWFDTLIEFYSYYYNHKNYNFLGCDWSKKLLFSTYSLAKLLLDSLLTDSSISRSHSKFLINQSHLKL